MASLDPGVVGARYGDSIRTRVCSGQTESAGPESTLSRHPLQVHFPPNDDVHGRDPQRRVNVDSSRP